MLMIFCVKYTFIPTNNGYFFNKNPDYFFLKASYISLMASFLADSVMPIQGFIEK